MLTQHPTAGPYAREDLAAGKQTRHSSRYIVHVVTAVPPTVCGVGDYAFCVNEKIGQQCGFFPNLYAPEPSHSSTTKTIRLKETLQSAQVVILEYSPYSYQRYGIANWLLSTISKWKASAPGRRVVTVFHELYATGKLWSTAFWTSPLQRYVTRKLAELSDGAITTTRRQAEILLAWNSRMEVALLAVPSNVGELRSEQLNGPRENMLVVFGQSGTRKRLYLGNQEGWARICRSIPISVIHDIGPSTELPISELTGLACVQHGHLSPSEVSGLLQSAQFGILDYSGSTLDKSGVFAAYSAHGAVPIVFRHSTPHNSALREGEHFLTPSSLDLSSTGLLTLSRNAHQWYCGHDLNEHSRTICNLLALKTTGKGSAYAIQTL
jgi:hypothetical protein